MCLFAGGYVDALEYVADDFFFGEAFFDEAGFEHESVLKTGEGHFADVFGENVVATLHGGVDAAREEEALGGAGAGSEFD